jgi:hypothetical protein
MFKATAPKHPTSQNHNETSKYSILGFISGLWSLNENIAATEADLRSSAPERAKSFLETKEMIVHSKHTNQEIQSRIERTDALFGNSQNYDSLKIK